MDLSKIMAISGKNGLFSVVSQSKAGLIVESLTDGKKIPVFATDRSNVLEDISIFTYGEDVPLKDILLRIYEKEEGKPTIDPKSEPDLLKAYFETIVPNFDKERVYHSDIKKMMNWYNILLDKDLISKPTEDEAQQDSLQPEGEDKPEKMVKKAPSAVNLRQTHPGQKQGKVNTPKRQTHQKK